MSEAGVFGCFFTALTMFWLSTALLTFGRSV